MDRDYTVEDFTDLPDFLRIEYINGRWCKGGWSELLIDDEVFKYPECAERYNIYRLSLANVGRKCFEISDVNFEKVKMFEEQHRECQCEADEGKFTYTFVPTSDGTKIIVKCACGSELVIDEQEKNWGEKSNRVVTEEDMNWLEFQDVVESIREMREPGAFERMWGIGQEFKTIYCCAMGATIYSSKRNPLLANLFPYELVAMKVFKVGTEEEKIKCFYELFEKRVKEIEGERRTQ